MNFDVSDPKSGQSMREYLTPEYFAQLNAAVRYALEGKNISGGPGCMTSQFGRKTTIRGVRRLGGGGGIEIPLTDTIAISAGEDEFEGYWVDEDDNRLDCIELDICVLGVEKKLRLLGMIIEPS